jgi:hypothetical protein
MSDISTKYKKPSSRGTHINVEFSNAQTLKIEKLFSNIQKKKQI